MKVHRNPAVARELAERPLFKSPMLNRSIILKHRLRRNEYDYFLDPPSTATKIILPIDLKDLRSGGYTCFVGQRNFEQLAAEHFGDGFSTSARDQQILDVMNALPSLDPFLLRENLRQIGIEPSRYYFNVSEADSKRMFEFARKEISALTALTGAGQGVNNSGRLVEKLLSNSPDAEFEPLRIALKLNGAEYLDGLFAWRGFLYYKWMNQDLQTQMKQVISELASTRPYNAIDTDSMAHLEAMRRRLQRRLAGCSIAATKYIDYYDKAFTSLTQENNPSRFRDFLLAAPEMFMRLGENLGAVQHIVSFWRFRFPAGRYRLIDAHDLLDVFGDFEASIGGED